MKVGVFIGKGIDNGRLIPSSALSKFKNEKLDLHLMINTGAGISLEALSEDQANVVIINGHGNVEQSQKDGAIVKTAIMDEVIVGKKFTIDSVIEIYNKLHPQHFNILGCYQGTLIHDLKRNIDEFKEGTTFFIPASSKYSVHSFEDELLIEDLLKSYSTEEILDPVKFFAQQIQKNPQTLFFAKVVKDAQTLENKLIAFKAIGPKYPEEIQDIQKYFTSRAIKKASNATKEYLKNCLITLEGDTSSGEYKALYKTIDNVLKQNNNFSREQHCDYILKNLFNSILRNKHEQAHAWITQIKEGDERVSFINTTIKDSSPLYLAASKNYTKILKILIDNGADIDALNSKWKETALYKASEKGNFDAVKMLIENGADFRIPKLGGCTPSVIARLVSPTNDMLKKLKDQQDTPLLFALQNKHFETAISLIKQSKDLNNSNKSGVTPLWQASLEGNLDIVKLLIAYGADVNSLGIKKTTALCIAAEQNYQDIVRLLVDAGANTNFQGNNGVTPLYMAAQNGFFEIVDLLLKKGADVNLSHTLGMTPIYIALSNKHFKIADRLIDHGASVNTPGNFGITPIWKACETGNIELVNLLINEFKVDVNSTGKNQTTALCIASETGKIDIVKILLEHKANVNIQASSGVTPLYMAVHDGHSEVVESLLINGADINLAHINGTTPLDIAVNKGYVKIVPILLDAGASSNLLDNKGNSLIDIARQKNYKQIAEILESYSQEDSFMASNDNLSPPPGYEEKNISPVGEVTHYPET